MDHEDPPRQPSPCMPLRPKRDQTDIRVIHAILAGECPEDINRLIAVHSRMRLANLMGNAIAWHDAKEEHAQWCREHGVEPQALRTTLDAIASGTFSRTLPLVRTVVTADGRIRKLRS